MTSLDAMQTGARGAASRPGIAGVRVSLDVRDLARIETMFLVAPQIVARHIRDAFGQFAGSHRRAVLRGAQPSYQRLLRRSLFYRVQPKQAARSTATTVGALIGQVPNLDAIRLRVWATSEVTLLHEVGGTVTAKAGKSMAIPVRGSASNVSVRRVRGRDRAASSPAAMAVEGVQFVRRGKLLFRVDKTAKGKDRLKLTHLLTGMVNIKPALGILRTWHQLAGDRQQRLQRSIDKIAHEMALVVGKSAGNALRRAIPA